VVKRSGGWGAGERGKKGRLIDRVRGEGIRNLAYVIQGKFFSRLAGRVKPAGSSAQGKADRSKRVEWGEGPNIINPNSVFGGGGSKAVLCVAT